MQNLKIMNNNFITRWSLLSTLKALKQAIPDCWTDILWAQPITLDNFRNVERMNDSGLLLLTHFLSFSFLFFIFYFYEESFQG